jgi:D-alanyl-lipoteichoic acid acyltransferase DltB (MBOAT superfamily)
MEGRALDLFNTECWIFIAAAVLLVAISKHPGMRRWVMASVNLSLFVFLLGFDSGYVLVGVVVTWFLLREMGRSASRGWFALFSGLSVVGVFVCYKLSRSGWDLGFGRINYFLATVGFSYVTLRLLEVGRAVAEGRHPAPNLAGAINYLLPFHMISAGPIQSYDDFVAQPAVPPRLGLASALSAFERIATGLFKKFVLANLIEKLFLTGFRAKDEP